MASQTQSATQSTSPSFAARLREVMISHHAVTRVYDDACNVIETHEPSGRVQRAMNKSAPKALMFFL
jgi:hypothetical protein